MELFVTPIPVIALAGFIVITEHALLVYDIRQMVLEGMLEPDNGMRQAPQNQLRELVSARTIRGRNSSVPFMLVRMTTGTLGCQIRHS